MRLERVVKVLAGGVVLASILEGRCQEAPKPVPPVPPPVVVPSIGQPPTNRPPVHAPPPATAVNMANLPETVIAWDSGDKAVTVDAGTPTANFSFSFTNVSAKPVVVSGVRTSCGCTTAQLPAMPWTIPAGSNEVLHITMTLAGKQGTIPKSVTFSTDKGTKHLMVRTTILPLTTASGMVPGAREQNQMLARMDRQAVFKGDCASCHGEPAKGKLAGELYTAACGICHEAEHRASSVPDLKVAKQERNADYWRNWITSGKQGTMMPAFAVNEGGILTDEQISSLVDHLMKTMPVKPATQPISTVPPPAH